MISFGRTMPVNRPHDQLDEITANTGYAAKADNLAENEIAVTERFGR
jgi:hypothetical protein